MRVPLRIASSLLLFVAPLCAQSPRREPAALKDLVPAGDSLASQGLQFDASFAQRGIEYLRSGDAAILRELANSAAAAHLLNHARNFDYDVPKESTDALVADLLVPAEKHRDRIGGCEKIIQYFYGPMLRDPRWILDTLRYLPEEFRFRGALFLTYGYDIGVAFGSNASLNCTHRRFEEHPSELLYYAIHELHHVGFMAYQPPPKLADLKTCADVLALVRYSTQLEGMAVLAAYQRRSDERALAVDPDYVALADEQRMQRDEASYFEDVRYLERRGTEPADSAAWAVIERMSGGERLWYRVGARMAMTIEHSLGRAALVDTIRKGPASFAETYWKFKTGN